MKMRKRKATTTLLTGAVLNVNNALFGFKPKGGD